VIAWNCGLAEVCDL